MRNWFFSSCFNCWLNCWQNCWFRYDFFFLNLTRILYFRNRSRYPCFSFSFSLWRFSRIIFRQINLFTRFMFHSILSCYYFFHGNFIDIVVIIGVYSRCMIFHISNGALFSLRIQWFHNLNFSLFQILFYFDRLQASIIFYNGRWLC